MKLEEKIQDRKVIYLLRKDSATAFELALFYYILAKRKKSREKISDAINKAVFWLKKAGIEAPQYLKQLSCFGQLEEIQKMLVVNRAKINARLAAAPAKDCNWRLAADFVLA